MANTNFSKNIDTCDRMQELILKNLHISKFLTVSFRLTGCIFYKHDIQIDNCQFNVLTLESFNIITLGNCIWFIHGELNLVDFNLTR